MSVAGIGSTPTRPLGMIPAEPGIEGNQHQNSKHLNQFNPNTTTSNNCTLRRSTMPPRSMITLISGIVWKYLKAVFDLISVFPIVWITGLARDP